MWSGSCVPRIPQGSDSGPITVLIPLVTSWLVSSSGPLNRRSVPRSSTMTGPSVASVWAAWESSSTADTVASPTIPSSQPTPWRR